MPNRADRIWAATALVVAVWLAVDPGLSEAHLSLIREGLESAGQSNTSITFGHTVLAADFDGDGFDDLATGTPIGNRVVINWGTALGLTQVDARLLTGVMFGGGSQDSFGLALAAGDFDKNGRPELVVGSPGLGGRVYVLSIDRSGTNAVMTIDQSSCGGTTEWYDEFGASLAVGDMNGDGYPDLAIGSPGEDNGCGVIYVDFLGGPNGLTTEAAHAVNRTQLGDPNVPYEFFGAAMVSANLLDGDAAELVVGCPQHPTSAPLPAGRVYVLYGSAAGVSTSSPVHLDNTSFPPVSGGYFGFTLAAGHLFAGSYASLVVGAPGDGGRVVVIEGGPLALDIANPRILTEGSGGCGSSVGDDPGFGVGIAVGPFEGPTTYDDLVVGAPSFDGPPYGRVYVFPGGASGPSGSGCTRFDRQGLDHPMTPADDEFGAAIAIGKFDATAKGALAIGAPDEPYDADGIHRVAAGAVHVVAPWRQVEDFGWYRAAVFDCEGQPVYTKRAFERTRMAETALAMVALIAAERTQLPPGDPGYVDPDSKYQVSPYVADQVGGANLGLEAGEHISLRDLIVACLYSGANDVGFAIADFVGKGPTLFDRVADFVTQMNARSTALGMLNSHFAICAGFDNLQWSCAWDMAVLSRAVLQNPLTRQVAASKEWAIHRELLLNGQPVALATITLQHSFSGMQISNASGVMGGYSNDLMVGSIHGLFSVQGASIGDVIATTFDTPSPSLVYVTDAKELLALGGAQCTPLILPTWMPLPRKLMATGLALVPNTFTGISGNLPGATESRDPESDPWVIEVFRQDGVEPVNAGFEWCHTAEVDLAPAASATLGLAPFSAHDDLHVLNMDDAPRRIRVALSSERTPVDYDLAAGEDLVIPAFASPTPLPSFTLTLTSLSAETAHLAIETDYDVDLTAIGDPNVTPAYRAQLIREGNLSHEHLEMLFSCDGSVMPALAGPATDAGHLAMVAHPSAEPVGVVPDAPGGASPGTGALALYAPVPNPFHGATRLAFQLNRAGRVSVAVHDLQGRRVKAWPDATLAPGSWQMEWNGRSDDGAPLASGVYFVRLALDGGPPMTHAVVIAR